MNLSLQYSFLISSDPRQLPKSALQDGSLYDVAPPVFTYETRNAKRKIKKSVGDNFKASCEALGSPQPEIFWFKDGHHIDESVHYQDGKSTVEFSVMGTADSGVYTCRARNLVGERTMNFTLDVRSKPGVAAHAIVTDSGPMNTTVVAGDAAMLQCRVKAVSPPHIKWLKRLESHEATESSTLRVGQERYRILSTSEDELLSKDEYLSRLILEDAKVSDSGMYICFVTNSGFGALTYNAMRLKVYESKYFLTFSCKTFHIYLFLLSVIHIYCRSGNNNGKLN